MTVLLPEGWTNFVGGGSDPELCGESECESPPCDMTINPTPTALSCADSDPVLSVSLSVDGGVLPLEWSTTDGQIVVTGLRTAELRIDNLWDPEEPVVVGGQANNPCNVAAFIFRGRAIWADDGGPGVPVSCSHEVCYGLVYNCKGEVLQGNISLGSSLCDDTREAVWIANKDDPNAVGFGYAAVYENCDLYPGGWPIVCLSNSLTLVPTADWSCSGLYSNCLESIWTSKAYATTGTCDEFTDNPLAGSSGLTPESSIGGATPIAGSICDVRHEASLAAGCAPCKLLEDSDIVVTVTDAAGVSTTLIIHVNL